MKQTLAILALAFCCAVPTVSQGLYWEAVHTAKDGKEEGSSKFYYMPRMYKAVMEDGKNAVIVRLDEERMLVVDYQKKAYFEMTFDEMEEMMKGAGSQMQEVMKQMEKELANLPADQRKMVEEMMGKNPMMKGETKTEVRKTGESKKISGYSCTKYVLKEDGEESAAIWATKEIGDFKGMRKDMEEFGRRMAAMMPANLASKVDRSMAAIDGFPVRTEMSDGTAITVTTVEKRSTPAAEFEPPSGFKRESAPMMER